MEGKGTEGEKGCGNAAAAMSTGGRVGACSCAGLFLLVLARLLACRRRPCRRLRGCRTRLCVNCAGRRGKWTVSSADAQAGPPPLAGQGLEEAAVRARGRTDQNRRCAGPAQRYCNGCHAVLAAYRRRRDASHTCHRLRTVPTFWAGLRRLDGRSIPQLPSDGPRTTSLPLPRLGFYPPKSPTKSALPTLFAVELRASDTRPSFGDGGATVPARKLRSEIAGAVAGRLHLAPVLCRIGAAAL